MEPGDGSWATRRLAEFLTSVSAHPDEGSVVLGAVEWIAEALRAEVAAIVSDGVVIASVGFSRDDIPVQRLLSAAAGEAAMLGIPSGEGSTVLVVRLENQNDSRESRLLLARIGSRTFTNEEASLAQAVAASLNLTLRMHRLLDEARRQERENAALIERLSERQALLERLSRIQSSISHRADLKEVLDTIVSGVRELLRDDIGALLLIDSDDPEHLVQVSTSGVAEQLHRLLWRRPTAQGATGQAFTERSLIVIEEYPESPRAMKEFVELGVQATMAAPVHDNGVVVGALNVSSLQPGRRYSVSEREVLLAFAEHVSLALTEAHTVEVRHEDIHDPLTGLANRALFMDRLGHALARCERERTRVGVMFIDLDRFKMVNDSLGHAAGDQLLVAAAKRLTGCLRTADTTARLGGDEFVVLIEDLEMEDLVMVRGIAERIMAALKVGFGVGGREVFIAANIGIAFSSGSAQDADELLSQADLAMYRAKTDGSQRLAVFESAMHEALLQRLELEADLQHAIDRQEFVVHYQPVIDLVSGHMRGAEALVRWAHPTRGLLAPGEFLEVAEETGMIVPLGWWVLDEALRQADEWSFQSRDLFVSVNLSIAQLAEPDVVGRVDRALVRSGIQPQRLILELTETMLMRDTEATIAKLWRIRKLGVRLAIDDFGIGYSSLAYLRRFPIDILKVAKPFVDGVALGTEESVIARAIINLSQTLQLQAVAEGIEHPAQMGLLRELGCQLGQGFLFARPLCPADFESTMLNSAHPRLAAM